MALSQTEKEATWVSQFITELQGLPETTQTQSTNNTEDLSTRDLNEYTPL